LIIDFHKVKVYYFSYFILNIAQLKNAEHFSEPTAKLSEGGVGRASCQRHKCVPRLRGTRKGGGVFDASDRQGKFMK